MITKENYHKIKRYIKYLSKPQVRQLCSDMELNDFESKMLLSNYDNELVIKFCIDNYISESCYKKHIKNLYSKIYNYFTFTNTSF